MVDVDEDGLQDIIVGVAQSYGFYPVQDEDEMKKICKKQGREILIVLSIKFYNDHQNICVVGVHVLYFWVACSLKISV